MELISVTVRYSGLLRECCGDTQEDKVEIPAGTTIEMLATGLIYLHPRIAPFRKRVQASVNDTVLPCSTALADGDIITLAPRLDDSAEEHCGNVIDLPAAADA
ncbi:MULTISPECIES: MoaD/ThiS family protein [unclassified Mycobacterium]|uniref:MoaD/ThiS family protein n=1 Tax=unclassified Mycobacterium TaxID=2642494 RepID=UPI002740C497|nr:MULTISPECIES: MoaD/ThiS family protein [unclassified Mycobacterium]MDP7706345.1 MoaD/ThiS family protein [Mycobacterium sp. TY815]MDP7725881.1 MoaD/ThiS family protein [Mycobacterium sp. TY814]